MSTDYTAAEADVPVAGSGHRNYEVYQRERVGETTNLVNPRDLISDDYVDDPFTVAAVLRENYPCFRDWVGNRFWVTRYDDVTSIFADDANFETRPKQLAYAGEVSGDDLGPDVIEKPWADLTEAVLDVTIARLLDTLSASAFDLARDFADRLAIELFGAVMGAGRDAPEVFELLSVVQAGTGWDERDRVAGIAAFRDLRRWTAGQLVDRKQMPAGDMLTVFADLGASSDDVAMSLVAFDLDTLPASMANMWCLLMTDSEQLDLVRSEPRLMKFAYLESLRHSPSVVTADRFARHEVERFGRLLPAGALVHLSAAAANRDPRYFENPDRFDLSRKDVCQREPRGQYRADGLPAGIAFGHGKPSGLAAVPKDGPRSSYARTLDIAVAASLALLERFPDIALVAGAEPAMALDRLGGTYRCRSLPVIVS